MAGMRRVSRRSEQGGAGLAYNRLPRAESAPNLAASLTRDGPTSSMPAVPDTSVHGAGLVMTAHRALSQESLGLGPNSRGLLGEASAPAGGVGGSHRGATESSGAAMASTTSADLGLGGKRSWMGSCAACTLH